MKKTPNIKRIFRDLSDQLKERLANEKSPLLLGLAALEIAGSHSLEYLSVDEIVDALAEARISLKRDPLTKAFSRAGNQISVRRDGDAIRYRVMIPGSNRAKAVLAVGNLQVLYVAGDKPRSDMKRLADVLSDLQGTIRISDPYYGERSLDALEMIPEKCQTRFLTARTTENQAKLKRALVDFRRERPLTEIRVYPNPKELHDRYVLSDNRLLIVGHGLKDVGHKESFVITLSRSLAADLLDDLRAAFDDRWGRATPL